MGADVQFVQDIVAEFPYFEETYDAHCYPDEDVYPHVVFWDITQAVVRSFVARGSHALDWRAVLVFLEERVSRDVPEVTVVICTSFLWNLPFPDDPGYGITEHLGPVLARRFQEVRPNG